MIIPASLYRVVVLLIVVATTCPVSAQEFEAFRLKSGMTVERVQKAVAPLSYELRLDKQQGSPGWATGVIAKPLSDVTGDDSDIYAGVSFCNGTLVSVSRNIDPDTEFPTYVEKWLRDLGQPRVSLRREPWTGPGGGEIVTLEFDWSHDGVKSMLMLHPEGRTGSGQLRYTRAAAVFFTLEKYSCLKK